MCTASVIPIMLGASLVGSAYSMVKSQEQAEQANAAQKKAAESYQEALSKANSQPVESSGKASEDASASRQRQLEALRSGMASTIKTSSRGVGSATTVGPSIGTKTRLGQ